MKKYFYLLAILTLFPQLLKAQCSVSNSDYSVTVYVYPISVVAPNSCDFGYNYNLNVGYNVSISGSNPPSSLYTLQGTLTCGSQTLFVDLPNSGGYGTAITTSNPYRTQSDCATVTPQVLNCNSFSLEAQGPGPAFTTFSATTGCSTSDLSLPVKVTKFEGLHKNGVNYISWVLNKETDLLSLQLERSYDALNFETMALLTVEDKWEDNTTQLSYRNAYYRLKTRDAQGNLSYSKIITVDQYDPNLDWSVYPNPASMEDAIRINSGKTRAILFSLADLKGRPLIHGPMEEWNKIEWSKSGIKNQTVILTLKDELGRSYSKRLVLN